MAGPGKEASARTPVVLYRERRSAWTWQLLVAAVLGPLAAEVVFVLLGVLVNPQWFVAAGVLPCSPVGLACAALAYRNWPTGIEIDDSGIRVGAVGSPEAAQRQPTVNHQTWAVFTCPWGAVRSVRVVSDQEGLTRLRTSPELRTLTNRWAVSRGMKACKLGVFTAPFMRGALVVELVPRRAEFPEIRSTRVYSNGKTGTMSRALPGEPSSTWVIPTRRPDELRASLGRGHGHK